MQRYCSNSYKKKKFKIFEKLKYNFSKLLLELLILEFKKKYIL